jgi:hypothetical protein
VVTTALGRHALWWEQHTQEVLLLLRQQDEDLEGMRLEARGIVLEVPNSSPENLEAIRRRFRDRATKLVELVGGDNRPQMERLEHLLEREREWSRLTDEAAPASPSSRPDPEEIELT